MKGKWQNLGDVNHRVYGGFFVRQLSDTEYEFVRTYGVDFEDSEDFAQKGYEFDYGIVDVSDGWIDIGMVMNIHGVSPEQWENLDGHIKAMLIAESYSYEEFGDRIYDKNYYKTLRKLGVNLPRPKNRKDRGGLEMTDEQKIKWSRILLEQGYITPEQHSRLIVENNRIVSDADFPVKFEGEKVHIWHHGFSYPPMTYNLNRILDDSRGELEMSVTQLNININMLKDTLYYLSQDVQEPLAKKQGVIVGVVGGLMAAGMTYNEAVSIVNENLPADADLSCVPDAWKGDIRKEK